MRAAVLGRGPTAGGSSMRAAVLGVVLTFVGGCASLSRGGYIDPSPGATRAGILELRWRRRIADIFALDWRPTFHGAPAYDPVRGRVYAGSVDHGLYALRASDGAVVWRFETLGRVDSTPTFDGDDVFFGSSDGSLYAVEARSGRMRWRVATSAEVVHVPLVFQHVVYFVNANDTVFAVSRADGSVRWRYHRNPPGGITLSGHAGLARLGNRLYAAFSDGAVVCLDATDGSVVWEQDTSLDVENIEERNEAHEPIDVDTTPVILGDTIYVASYAAGLYALDAVGGGRRWRLDALTGVSALGTDGRYLYAFSATSGLLKIDPLDGTVLWARDLGSSSVVGVMSLGSDLLVVPTADNALWVVRSVDGEPIDGIAPGRGFGALPALVGGRLFAISTGGTLYAFRVTALHRDFQ